MRSDDERHSNFLSPKGERMSGDRLARYVSLASLLFLVAAFAFATGVALMVLGIGPSRQIAEAAQTIGRFVEVGAFVPRNLVFEPKTEGVRTPFAVTPGRAPLPGYRVVMGYDVKSAGYGAWLFAPDGRMIHFWPIDYASIDPDGPSGGTDEPHGMLVLADGSIIANFDKGDAMARFDRCGQPVWVLPGHFHHSLSWAADRSIWTLRGADSAYSQYQYITQVDANSGRKRREIGLVEDLLTSPEARLLFGLPETYRVRRGGPDHEVPDVFHINDVDELTPDLARAFPQFRPGDLLLSIRNNNLVAVVDPATKRLRWWSHGPWLRQHDPDFRPDGTISVFNNNPNRDVSDVVVVDPSTRHVRSAIEEPGIRFYTEYQGKQQQLPNGGLLVVVTGDGQVREFDANGRLVLTINNIYSDRRNAYVGDAAWLPLNYFRTLPTSADCPARS